MGDAATTGELKWEIQFGPMPNPSGIAYEEEPDKAASAQDFSKPKGLSVVRIWPGRVDDQRHSCPEKMPTQSARGLALASAHAATTNSWMNELPYMFRLGVRLANGLSRMDADRRARHSSFLAAQQQVDGGFPDRQGKSDLYYTSFALRALAALDGLDDSLVNRVGSFLRTSPPSSDKIVDLMGRVQSSLFVLAAGGPDLLESSRDGFAASIGEDLERFRSPDGGYAHEVGAASGSTYQSFLAAATYDLVGKSPPNPEQLREFILRQRREDGGFVEFKPVKRGGTNPTAAAVGCLALLQRLEAHLVDGVCEFFQSVRFANGAFAANTRVPTYDLLSTFTAALTIQDLGLDDLIEHDGLERFLRSVEFENGGFCAASWDDQPDVEYTFYGLGLFGLLTCEETQQPKAVSQQ